MANKTVSSKIDNMIKTLWNFYDYFHGSYKDYLLIVLYAPTVVIGVIANIFVIVMVCKYHLKRYVIMHMFLIKQVQSVLITNYLTSDVGRKSYIVGKRTRRLKNIQNYNLERRLFQVKF